MKKRLVSCNRFSAGLQQEMHQSYQFKNYGKQVNLHLPWTTYHTQVTWRIFYSRPEGLQPRLTVLLFRSYYSYRICLFEYYCVISVVPFCRWTVANVSSLFQVKQKEANQVHLWLTNSLVLPITVFNVSLPQKLQGVMKVCTVVP